MVGNTGDMVFWIQAALELANADTSGSEVSVMIREAYPELMREAGEAGVGEIDA